MCATYTPYTFPYVDEGDIRYPTITWKCFLKHVELVSFDLISFELFVWSLTVYMHSTSCIKTVISLLNLEILAVT